MIPPRWPELPWNAVLVFMDEWSWEGRVEAASSAAYVQDSWTPTPNLTLNLGLRWERYRNRNAAGATFLEVDDQVSPRLGVAWDPAGDGRSKLYGSIGRYHLPYPTNASVQFGLRVTERVRTYVVEGEILDDGTPEGLGELLADEVVWDGDVLDPRWVSADSIAPITQRELILGYQRTIGERWTVGVRGVGRELEETIEDINIIRGVWEAYGVEIPWYHFNWGGFLGNPGRDFSGWYDLDGDGLLDPIYLTAEQLGIPAPERSYYAVELSAERRFSQSWMLFAAYTWAHSYGNHEGLVNSDLGRQLSGFNPAVNSPLYLEHANGDLPNDRRHQVKVYGAHAWQSGLQLGGTLFFRTGRPINSFGFHPADSGAFHPFAFYTAGEPTPRGSMGRTDDVWSLGLTFRYTWSWGNAELDARVDVFNVFNNQAVAEVEELGEFMDGNGVIHSNPDWGQTTFYQSPRSLRFGVGVSF